MRSSSVVDRPPGPKAGFVDQLAFTLAADPLGFFTRVARQYGDVAHWHVRSLDFYLLNDPALIREALVAKAGQFQKAPALQRAKMALGEGLLTSEGDFHRRQRRLSQPAFHATRVAAYARVFSGYAQDTARRWNEGQSIDAHDEMMALTLRIVAKTLFDADVEAEVEAIGRAMDISVGMFTRNLTPWGQLLNLLPLPSNFRYRRAHARLIDTILGFIRQRRESGVDRGDLLSMLLAAQDVEGDGGGMSDKQLIDECYTLFTAGHETTANALTFALHLLSRHPDAQERLHKELDEIPDDAPLEAAAMERLPFTRAVIAEGMRLYPPAWIIGRQATSTVQIGQWEIQEKAVVLMSQWVMHRDARFWPEPMRFMPERWLTPVSESERPRYAYFPFGGGPRQCIGESFAWMEATLALAALARGWTFEPIAPEPLELQPTITLRPKRGLPLRLRRRN